MQISLPRKILNTIKKIRLFEYIHYDNGQNIGEK